MGQLQDFLDVLGNVAEFQVSPRLACAGEGADHGAQAAAIDENDIAKMEHNGAAIAQDPGNVAAQRFDFVAGDQASFAADNRYPADFPCLEG
ncbi:MAG TPA: hypothetical protein VE377_11240 [Candidatus Dormibacteraeota bacterium]|nr:hypothetical protein [Candidatus Dormibacteraeota bacterium]